MTNYPIFIVSKGRWESRLTSKALESMNLNYRIVVEEQEYENYKKFIKKEKILILPKSYLENYDTCDNYGLTKSVGPGAARNFCWDLSIKEGYSRHWVMDDNLDAFHRLNRNKKFESMTHKIFLAQENFVDRYENIAISGPNYYSFVKKTDKVAPFILNTRIYSCLLIKNNIPFRWRARYNEDTDLSLRVLKAGYCTLQFNAFLCGKVTTQRMKGGNTKDFYSVEGTLPKSEMLEKLHPDVAKVVWKFNRWHHHVDYRIFKKNKLIKKENLNLNKTINEYGMKLVKIER
jgi:hypothetical protein